MSHKDSMLAIEALKPDTVIHWSIEQLMDRPSSDSGWYDSWLQMLEEKREDFHYPEVLESIRRRGFVRPLNAAIVEDELRLSDGHHRVAAAIDLGMETVPVFISGDWHCISDDSGAWSEGDYIPEDPADNDDYRAGISYY